MGVAAVVQTAGPVSAPQLVVPPIAGLLAGLALVFLRVGIVPHSSGVFLKAFSASGAEIRLPKAPLDPYGQKDLTETMGVHPRSLHEPIAALGDDSLWTASRSDSGECTGHWIQRRGLSVDAPEWRRCLASEAGVVRNLTGMTMDSSRGLIIVGFDVRENLESWWMRRFDAEGRDDDHWNKASSAEMKIDRTYAALVDADGVYVLGESGDVQLPGTFGWIRKYDREGRESSDGWNKRFPNAGEGRPTMAAIAAAVDADGNLYVLLDLYGALSIRKFDRDGRELPGWPKDLSGRKDVTLAVNPSGNLMVAGITDYPDQGWLAKFEPDGVLAWDKKFALGHLTAAYAVGFDRVGGVYAAGFKTSSNEKSTDWWIKKFSSDGREFSEWDKTVVGTSIGVAPFAMRVDARDDIYILGSGSGWRFSSSRLEHWWGWE
jgi:hypothetical protein